MYDFKILPFQFFDEYQQHLTVDLAKKLAIEKEKPFTSDVLGFYTSVSSVFSSKIEGESIELDSFLKHKFFKVKFLPDYTRKIDDLFSAYDFARQNPLTLKNLLKAHDLLTLHILSKTHRGKIRTSMEFIIDQQGQIEYVAAEPHLVKIETEKLFDDITLLLEKKLNVEEIFYFASLIQLVFLKIHPFADGNGRSARLLEKWFYPIFFKRKHGTSILNNIITIT